MRAARFCVGVVSTKLDLRSLFSSLVGVEGAVLAGLSGLLLRDCVVADTVRLIDWRHDLSSAMACSQKNVRGWQEG